MAKNMAEKEPLAIATDFLKKLSEAATRLAQKKGISEGEATKVLKMRAQAALEKQALVKQSERTKKVESAKNWKAKARDPEMHAEAVRESMAAQYPDSLLKSSQADLEKLIQTYKDVGKEVPSFLKATEIQYSPEAAAFAYRVAQLPKDLQENPYILHQEAAKLYWSMDWMSASSDAVHEVRGVLDRTFEHVQTKLVAANPDFGSARPSELWQNMDGRPDIYRTHCLVIDDAGDAPTVTRTDRGGRARQWIDKDTKEYKAWRVKKNRQVQQGNLHNYLYRTQLQLDNELNQDPSEQYSTLKDAYNQLELGAKKPIRDEHQFTEFHADDVDSLKEQVKAERNRFQRIMLESDPRRQRLTYDHFVAHGIRPVSRSPLETRLEESQVWMILDAPDDDGETGADKFYELMADRIFTSSREARPPDLADQYEFQEMEKVLRHVFGEEQALATLSKYRDRWDHDYIRNAAITRLFSGLGGDKELIMEMSRSIPTETLNYETRIQWSPEAIRAYEESMFEAGVEQRFEYDEGVRKLRILNARPTLTPVERAEKDAILREIGDGSIIKDYLMSPNSPEYFRLVSLHDAIRFKVEFQGKSIVDAIAGKEDALGELWRKVTLRDPPTGEALYNFDYLNKIRGLSPLEIRVYDKLEAALRLQDVKDIDDKSYKLRRAILSARRYMFGSKRGITLIGHLSNMVGLEVDPGGADVMVEGAGEYFLRNEIMERFERRFSIGGDNVGLRLWAKGQEQLAEERGLDIQRMGPLKPGLTHHESIPMRMARTVNVRTRERYGVGYTQLAMGTMLGPISHSDGSDWRNKAAIWDVLSARYGDHAKNIALGIRLQMAGTGVKPEQIAERLGIIELMTQRTPSKLFHLLGTEDFDNLLKGSDIVPGSQEWHRFMTALGLVEGRIQEQDALIQSTINVGNAADFNRLFDDDVFKKGLGVTDAGQITTLKGRYLKIIQDAQTAFEPYKAIWAKHNMPITLSMVDFDIEKADFTKLPFSHQYRRDVSDMGARFNAKGVKLGIYSTNSVVMPEDPKKVLIPEIQKFKAAINEYKDTSFAERRAVLLYDQVMSLNEARYIYRNVAHFVPFLPGVMRTITGQDMSKPWIRTLLEPVRRITMFGANLAGQKELAELLEYNAEEWPTIFGQELISGTVGATGPSGEALLPTELHDWVEDFEEAKIVTHEHKMLHKLRDKYGTRLWFRLFEVWQRFWWVPWASAAAVGVIVALQEGGGDKKSH